MEIDLVVHCGWSTDVATGWTECLPLLYRSQQTVIEVLDRVRQTLPFPLLALDPDNGKEFINTDLLAYCEREAIIFTRGRTGKKNDKCFVEQKNGSVVRQLVGYDRFEGDVAYRQLTEQYRAVRRYMNFFQPSMKLAAKRRECFRHVAALPFDARVGYVDKGRIRAQTLRDHQRLVQHVLSGRLELGPLQQARLSLMLDEGTQDKRYQRQFCRRLENVTKLRIFEQHLQVRAAFCTSQSEPLIQLADMVVGEVSHEAPKGGWSIHDWTSHREDPCRRTYSRGPANLSRRAARLAI